MSHVSTYLNGSSTHALLTLVTQIALPIASVLLHYYCYLQSLCKVSCSDCLTTQCYHFWCGLLIISLSVRARERWLTFRTRKQVSQVSINPSICINNTSDICPLAINRIRKLRTSTTLNLCIRLRYTKVVQGGGSIAPK